MMSQEGLRDTGSAGWHVVGSGVGDGADSDVRVHGPFHGELMAVKSLAEGL